MGTEKCTGIMEKVRIAVNQVNQNTKTVKISIIAGTSCFKNRFSSKEMTKRDTMNFIPFGAGPRQCIGQKLAILEIKIALTNVLKKFKVFTCEKTPVCDFKIPLHVYTVTYILSLVSLAVSLWLID